MQKSHGEKPLFVTTEEEFSMQSPLLNLGTFRSAYGLGVDVFGVRHKRRIDEKLFELGLDFRDGVRGKDVSRRKRWKNSHSQEGFLRRKLLQRKKKDD
ncbi:hypothetical protein Nepgr_004122 [Nepenthes gracilis]|uniref:Uncharacterized protein n=1 Tax=Nepenthes gracilis TaxID=150966 RepID=A0AAD3S0U8_NEPGR|nr:hypothetical protein Nepgr_004122 [Nepenthes gracilis]